MCWREAVKNHREAIESRGPLREDVLRIGDLGMFSQLVEGLLTCIMKLWMYVVFPLGLLLTGYDYGLERIISHGLLISGIYHMYDT